MTRACSHNAQRYKYKRDRYGQACHSGRESLEIPWPSEKPSRLFPPFIELRAKRHFAVIFPPINPVPFRRYHRSISRLPCSNLCPPVFIRPIRQRSHRILPCSDRVRRVASRRRTAFHPPPLSFVYLRVPSSPTLSYPSAILFFRSMRVRVYTAQGERGVCGQYGGCS
jgi:hypothetical protein